MSKQKQKGTAFETACVRYLRHRLDDDRIDRRSLSGAHDRGDIYGIYAHGMSGIAECKDYKTYCASMIKKFKSETLTERDNADADFALLIVHKSGCGKANFGQNTCYITMRDLSCLIFGDKKHLASDEIWCEMALDDVCKLILGEQNGCGF